MHTIRLIHPSRQRRETHVLLFTRRCQVRFHLSSGAVLSAPDACAARSVLACRRPMAVRAKARWLSRPAVAFERRDRSTPEPQHADLAPWFPELVRKRVAA